ncbi:MAG: hypothetical protein HEEMFOPI_01568 [Holosporales bacterium]
MLAAATRDASHESFAMLRSENNMAYTPISTYPFMKRVLLDKIDNKDGQLQFDGAWHDYDADVAYRCNQLSLKEWFKWMNKNPTEGFYVLNLLKMIVYGDHNSIDGPAGVVFEDVKTENGETIQVPSSYLIDLFIKDMQACENEKENVSEQSENASEQNVPNVLVGIMEFCFKTINLPTRRFFWVQDNTGKTDQKAITLLHPSGSVFPMHLELTQSLFNLALKSHDQSIEEKKIAVARFMYAYSLTMPFARGSALTNEWMALALYDVLNLGKLDRENLKKYDEYAQAVFSFKEYVSHVLPDVDVSSVELFNVKEMRPVVIFGNDAATQEQLKDFSVQVLPPISNQTDLCTFMIEAGSDKNSVRHTYTQLYNFILDRYRETATHVLEIGIGSCDPQYGFTMGPTGTPGASLRAYRSFFKNAQIYGADIDKEALFNEDRIQCFEIDGFKPDVIESCFKTMGVTFDYIVDDGFHDFVTNRNCVLEGMKHLKKDGIYIIEDVRTDQLPRFSIFFAEEMADYLWTVVKLPAFHNPYDNNVIIVRHKS